jgi:4-alpha-glucanotransferase
VAAAVADTGLSDEFARLEAAPLIDWEKAGRAKLALLRAVWKRLAPQLLPGSGPLAEDLEDFTRRGGEALRDHAVFEALQAAGHGGSLPDPRSADTAAFAREAAGEVAFHIFLQWLTDRSMSEAQTAALKAGQRIGLIADLAVGIEGGGSYAWSRPDDILSGVEIGAPPDLFNRQGQRWGLTAISPHALARQGFSPFIETLHAVLRHAGGLRIDHVLGLARLWLVPQGMAPGEGAYLRFPFQTLLALIALESHRHRAVIVGEDLGTVPHGLRNDLAAVGLMGMRVLWFEREGDAFQDAALWPRPVAAMTSTHDLPTVAGWWSGREISWRNKPGLPSAEDEKERAGEKTALWQAFRRAGLASGPVPTEAEEAVTAAVGFVARTPADLALIPLEDILGLSEQPNLPGTTSEHPNWCRRLPMETTQALAAPPPRQRLERLAGERPRS